MLKAKIRKAAKCIKDDVQVLKKRHESLKVS